MKGPAPCVDRTSATQSELNVLRQEIEELERLDLETLRRRWRAVLGRAAPAHLPRGLIVRVLAYQHQIACFGDLDPATRAALGEAAGERRQSERSVQADGSNRYAGSKARRVAAASTLRPGTVLEREYGGAMQRVTVTTEGCCWNGRNFRSLSEAAFAITGTKWNGPRFFGLRDAEKKPGQEKGVDSKIKPHARSSEAEALR